MKNTAHDHTRPEAALIKLLPFTPGHLRALLESEAAFEQAFGIRVAPGIGDFIRAGSPEYLKGIQTAREADVWRDGSGVLHLEENTIIGTCGFRSPPDAEGVVEIGYGIAPSFQRQGYATEAARLITSFAFDSGHVKKVIAHTLAGPNASTRVLEKCGFSKAGEIVDPEDGLVWRWENTQLMKSEGCS